MEKESAKMTPTQALFETTSCVFFFDSKRRWPGPGQLVERMRPEIREALGRLTSDEARKMPIELLGLFETKAEREAREKEEKERNDQAFAEDRHRRSASIRLRLMFDQKMKLQSSS